MKHFDRPFMPPERSRTRYADALIRAVVAKGRTVGTGADAERLAKTLFPDDEMVRELVTKGAVTPTATTTSGAPVATNFADLISILGPASASGGLFSRAIQLGFTGYNGVFIPTITASGSGVSFIAQGAPHPIKQLSADGPTLTPKKIEMGIMMTRELFEYSNAEAILRVALAENLSLGIDSILFDATGIDTTRPAGLLNGVAKIDATSGGGNEALITDLANLAAAIAPIAGMQIAYIASPKQAVKIALRRTTNLPFPVLSSGALADGVVVAVALNALAVVGGDAPRIEVSKTGALHMEDTSPLQISTVGTPPTVAAPIRSLDQTDSVALRLTTELNWSLRVASGAVAWTQSVTW